MFETLLGGRSTISRLVFIQSLDRGSQHLNRIVSSTSQIRAAVFSPHTPGFPFTSGLHLSKTYSSCWRLLMAFGGNHIVLRHFVTAMPEIVNI